MAIWLKVLQWKWYFHTIAQLSSVLCLVHSSLVCPWLGTCYGILGEVCVSMILFCLITKFPNMQATKWSGYIFAFQIATGASGRGVLRLLLIQQQINLLCIPAICLQLYIVAFPSAILPSFLCLILEVLLLIVSTNGTIGHITVALGRYCPRMLDDVKLGKSILSFTGYFISIKMKC